jgi:hypothetical protein
LEAPADGEFASHVSSTADCSHSLAHSGLEEPTVDKVCDEKRQDLHLGRRQKKSACWGLSANSSNPNWAQGCPAMPGRADVLLDGACSSSAQLLTVHLPPKSPGTGLRLLVPPAHPVHEDPQGLCFQLSCRCSGDLPPPSRQTGGQETSSFIHSCIHLSGLLPIPAQHLGLSTCCPTSEAPPCTTATAKSWEWGQQGVCMGRWPLHEAAIGVFSFIGKICMKIV